jgi:hypothetical protein
MKKLFSRFIVFITLALMAGPVLADDHGLGTAAGDLKNVSPDVPSLIGKLLGSVLGFTGTIFFILVIYSGLMWMTSGGKEEQITKARKILFAALAGLIIVLSAYAITRFIGSALTGSSTTP